MSKESKRNKQSSLQLVEENKRSFLAKGIAVAATAVAFALGRVSAAPSGNPREIGEDYISFVNYQIVEQNSRIEARNLANTAFIDIAAQNVIASSLVEAPTVRGGIAASGNLTLQSTSHATKGKLLFGTSAYDEVNNRLGIGTSGPAARAHIIEGGDAKALYAHMVKNDGGVAAAFDFLDDRGYGGANSGPSFNLRAWATGDDAGALVNFEAFNGTVLPRFYVDRQSGNIGIGTSNPLEAVHIPFVAAPGPYKAIRIEYHEAGTRVEIRGLTFQYYYGSNIGNNYWFMTGGTLPDDSLLGLAYDSPTPHTQGAGTVVIGGGALAAVDSYHGGAKLAIQGKYYGGGSGDRDLNFRFRSIPTAVTPTGHLQITCDFPYPTSTDTELVRITHDRGILPPGDNLGRVGEASNRWNLVRAVTVTQGDLGFEEKTCPIDQQPFKVGDKISLLVKVLDDDSVLTIPVHADDVIPRGWSTTFRVAKTEPKFTLIDGLPVPIKIPITKTIKKRTKRLRAGYSFNEKTGKFYKITEIRRFTTKQEALHDEFIEVQVPSGKKKTIFTLNDNGESIPLIEQDEMVTNKKLVKRLNAGFTFDRETGRFLKVDTIRRPASAGEALEEVLETREEVEMTNLRVEVN